MKEVIVLIGVGAFIAQMSAIVAGIVLWVQFGPHEAITLAPVIVSLGLIVQLINRFLR